MSWVNASETLFKRGLEVQFFQVKFLKNIEKLEILYWSEDRTINRNRWTTPLIQHFSAFQTENLLEWVKSSFSSLKFFFSLFFLLFVQIFNIFFFLLFFKKWKTFFYPRDFFRIFYNKLFFVVEFSIDSGIL